MYASYSVFNIFLSDFAASVWTLLPFGVLNYVWNAVAQAKGIEVKYALVLDWLDLSVRTHVGLMGAAVLALLGAKAFAGPDVPTIKAPDFEMPVETPTETLPASPPYA